MEQATFLGVTFGLSTVRDWRRRHVGSDGLAAPAALAIVLTASLFWFSGTTNLPVSLAPGTRVGG